MNFSVRNQQTNTTNLLYRSIYTPKKSQYSSNASDVKPKDIKTDETTDGIGAGETKDRFADTLLISGQKDPQPEDTVTNDTEDEEKNLEDVVSASSEQESDSTSAGSFKVSCSIPDDSTGQLASMLARAETTLDVQQVSSKALRAMNALKMASVFAEGDDAKKVTQRIRRMKKLISRISKKQQQLNKEETLELQRKSAERRKQMEQAQDLKKELDNKRNKRRRDERNYAAKENAQDNKEALQDMYANMANASSAAPVSASVPDLSAITDLGVSTADLSAAEGVSLDITV